MDEIALKSYAKLNLSLSIQGIREDRFHELQSEMQSVSLCDDILMKKVPGGIGVDCNNPKVPEGESNIAYKAARRFFEFTKIKSGIMITIRKNIPVAAGLAGGSSNAAAVIFGLDKLFETRLSLVQLASIGVEVGSDVPFCLSGGRCMVRGRGEVVQKLPMLAKMWFVIAVPDVEVATKWAYEEYDRWMLKVKDVKGVKEAKAVMHNDLEAAVSAKFPVIKELEKKLINAGAISSSMSGSGPSVFAMCSSEAHAQKVLEKVKGEFPRSFVAGSVDFAVEVI